jgi:SprT protein
LNLYRSLRKYDAPKESVLTVEKVPLKALFKIKDGRIFRKEEQLRKRLNV